MQRKTAAKGRRKAAKAQQPQGMPSAQEGQAEAGAVGDAEASSSHAEPANAEPGGPASEGMPANSGAAAITPGEEGSEAGGATPPAQGRGERRDPLEDADVDEVGHKAYIWPSPQALPRATIES